MSSDSPFDLPTDAPYRYQVLDDWENLPSASANRSAINHTPTGHNGSEMWTGPQLPVTFADHQLEGFPNFGALAQGPNGYFPPTDVYLELNHVENPSTAAQETYLPSLGQPNNCQALEEFNTGSYARANFIGNNYVDPGISDQATFLGSQTMSFDNNTQTGPPLNCGTSFGYPNQAYQGMHALPVLGPNQVTIPCTQQGCLVTFKRDKDRIRHEAAVHGINQVLHLCQVPGCPKGQGRSYSRADKLTEHMWKKHGNLGYVKRV